MRPRFTLRAFFLLLVAGGVAGGLWYWRSLGSPLPGGSRAINTAGKLAFVRTSNNGRQSDVYLINADGTDATPLTSDPAEDRSPAWSPNGSRLALTSDRKQNGYQVYLLDPRPGARPDLLTITSSTKNQPFFGGDGRVYYLASGQLVATTPGTSDADQIFPSAHLRLKLGQLLSTGGLNWARPSPDLKNVASVLRLESGEALLLSPTESVPVMAIAFGENIQAQWLPDNTLVALVRGGQVAPEPAVILDQALLSNAEAVPPPIPAVPPMDTHFLARFDASGKVLSVLPMPLAPSGFAAAPDGKRVAITVNQGATAGVALISSESGEAAPVFNRPASSPTWSPDGKTLAFVSGKDIYALPVGAGTPQTAVAAVNLTRGQGTNASPAWSPALRKETVAKK